MSIGHGVAAAIPVFGPMIIFFTLVAAVPAWRAAVHPRLDARTRSAWKWIGASFSLLTIAIVLFNVTPEESYPALAVAVKLTATLVLLIGLPPCRCGR